MKRAYSTLYLILLLFCFKSYTQGKFNLPDSETKKIKFELAGNLIVFPLEINGVELNFILDSGVSKPILFNIANRDSLQIMNVETIFLRGLGSNETVEALKSKNNKISVGNAININQDIYLVLDEQINFSSRLGIPVHGIIGYDIFKNFTVEINYSSKYFKLYKPEYYQYKTCKKCQTFPLVFNRSKPYIDAEVKISNDSDSIPIKLLIDTGSSDALWLFENSDKDLEPLKDYYFDDFLGKGLSGNVHGKRSKVESFNLGKFTLNSVNVAFPDSASISVAKRYKERDGSLSGAILKRFNIVFDYANSKITLKKNRFYKSKFKYNNSGLVLEQIGLRMVKEKIQKKSVDGYGNESDSNLVIDLLETYEYSLKPSFTIVELRENSPAKNCGLMKDDIVVSINGKETHNLKLQDILGKLSDKPGKTIRLVVERNGVRLPFKFKLEDVFKQKTLKN